MLVCLSIVFFLSVSWGKLEIALMRLRVLDCISSLGSAVGSTLEPVLLFRSATACGKDHCLLSLETVADMRFEADACRLHRHNGTQASTRHSNGAS